MSGRSWLRLLSSQSETPLVMRWLPRIELVVDHALESRQRVGLHGTGVVGVRVCDDMAQDSNIDAQCLGRRLASEADRFPGDSPGVRPRPRDARREDGHPARVSHVAQWEVGEHGPGVRRVFMDPRLTEFQTVQNRIFLRLGGKKHGCRLAPDRPKTMRMKVTAVPQ